MSHVAHTTDDFQVFYGVTKLFVRPVVVMLGMGIT